MPHNRLKKMETLTFDKRIREEQKDGEGRVMHAERNYYDFVISGLSAKTKLRADKYDLISPFGWGDEKYQVELIRQFTGWKKPELPNGRIMIYVCPECGDIGCGCISAEIEVTEDKVIWKNFGYESDAPDIDFKPYEDIPPIEFDKEEYLKRFEEIKR